MKKNSSNYISYKTFKIGQLSFNLGTFFLATALPISGLFFLFSIFISFLETKFYLFNEKIVPLSNQAADTLIKRELRKSPPPNIAENTIFKDSNRFFYIKTIRQNILENVMILEKTFQNPRIIIAKKAD